MKKFSRGVRGWNSYWGIRCNLCSHKIYIVHYLVSSSSSSIAIFVLLSFIFQLILRHLHLIILFFHNAMANSSLIKFLSSLDPCMPLQQQQKLDSLHHIIIIIHASVLKQQQYYQQQQHIYRSICVKHYIVGPGPWPSKLVSWPGLCCDIRRQISVLFVGKKKRWLVSLNESVGARLEACILFNQVSFILPLTFYPTIWIHSTQDSQI